MEEIPNSQAQRTEMQLKCGELPPTRTSAYKPVVFLLVVEAVEGRLGFRVVTVLVGRSGSARLYCGFSGLCPDLSYFIQFYTGFLSFFASSFCLEPMPVIGIYGLRLRVDLGPRSFYRVPSRVRTWMFLI